MYYRARGDTSRCLYFLDRAITLDSKKAGMWVGKGLCLSKVKRYDEALIAFRAALTINPNHWGARISMAETLEKLGQFVEALHIYKEVSLGCRGLGWSPTLKRDAELRMSLLEKHLGNHTSVET